MKINEPETIFQLVFDCVIMACAAIGTYTVFMIAKHNAELSRTVANMSISEDIRAKETGEMMKVLVGLHEEIRMVRANQTVRSNQETMLKKIYDLIDAKKAPDTPNN